jgi:hypothetical protein
MGTMVHHHGILTLPCAMFPLLMSSSGGVGISAGCWPSEAHFETTIVCHGLTAQPGSIGWMRYGMVTSLIPKFHASNAEFILFPTLYADVDNVVRCIRKLADAVLPSFATSVELFRDHICDVCADSAIAIIGIMKAAHWRECIYVCNAAFCQCRIVNAVA